MPDHVWESPTSDFLKKNSLEEIKYNLRLDQVTMVYKDIYDKAIAAEKEGFLGYHGNSREYRIFQDVIRMIVEEKAGVSVPSSFHFFDIPCFRNEKITDIKEVSNYYLPDKNLGSKIESQVFKINQALYGNYNKMGYQPIKYFHCNSSLRPSSDYINDLKNLFSELGMDESIVDQAFEVGATHLKDDRGILLQIFDESVAYSIADTSCYPSSPTGYPLANKLISQYYTGDKKGEVPDEVRMLLTNQKTLNPKASLRIQRFDKMQKSVVAKYEAQLRALIRLAVADPKKLEKWKSKLQTAWKIES